MRPIERRGMGALALAMLFMTHACTCGRARTDAVEHRAAPSTSAARARAGAAASETSTASRTVRVLPRIGGVIATSSEHRVELVLARSGRVEVVVSDRGGHPVTNGIDLTMRVLREQGERTTVTLRFDPRRERWLGHAPADARLVSGPVDFAISENERLETGHLERALAVPEARFGGYLMSTADFSAEVVPYADGRVEAHLYDPRAEPLNALPTPLSARLRHHGAETVDAALTYDAARALWAGRAASSVSPGFLELRHGPNEADRLARVDRIALAPTAEHAGRIVLAGNYGVELVQRDHQVTAWIYNAFAKPYPAANLRLMLALGGESRPLVVPLAWDANAQNYRARVEGEVSAAVRVSLTAGVHTFLGGCDGLRADGASR